MKTKSEFTALAEALQEVSRLYTEAARQAASLGDIYTVWRAVSRANEAERRARKLSDHNWLG